MFLMAALRGWYLCEAGLSSPSMKIMNTNSPITLITNVASKKSKLLRILIGSFIGPCQSLL